METTELQKNVATYSVNDLYVMLVHGDSELAGTDIEELRLLGEKRRTLQKRKGKGRTGIKQSATGFMERRPGMIEARTRNIEGEINQVATGNKRVLTYKIGDAHMATLDNPKELAFYVKATQTSAEKGQKVTLCILFDVDGYPWLGYQWITEPGQNPLVFTVVSPVTGTTVLVDNTIYAADASCGWWIMADKPNLTIGHYTTYIKKKLVRITCPLCGNELEVSFPQSMSDDAIANAATFVCNQCEMSFKADYIWQY